LNSCRAALAAWAALLAGGTFTGTAQAGSLRYCDRQAQVSVEQQDQLFRFGAIVKAELEASKQPLALVARSGLDLSWFGLRYSHAGFSLKDSPNGPWSVRQLYYACDEQKPRIFDQGISGFLLGTDNPAEGYVSLVFLPPGEGAPVERTALSPPQVLQLLAADYSANAYPWGLRYQNCNQWVVELLGSAWGSLSLGEPGDEEPSPRQRAQQWLREQGYAPMVVSVFPPLAWASAFVPWLHGEDHPPADRLAGLFRVSMPDAIEAFVRGRVPGATRVEICHAGGRVVIHRGWTSIPDGCLPSPGDEVLSLS
jgi:hypothetical protein